MFSSFSSQATKAVAIKMLSSATAMISAIIRKFFLICVFINAPFVYIPIWDNFTIPNWYIYVNKLTIINLGSRFEKYMRLKELRNKRNISQLKLALDLNLNQNSISRYETGEREAGYELLIRFADYFDVSVDYLLERTDNPKINR